jgi:hypothetical protein
MRRASPVALLCLGLLVTAGCADSSTPATTTSARASTPASDPPSTTPSRTTSSAASNAIEIAVSVKDGKVSPKTHREKVAKGSEIRLIVTSDVDDEVHVHGFDVEKELSAGQPTTLELTADQTGLFEVETHESGLQLLQLEVK